MIMEIHNGQMFLRPAIHLKHFPKVPKMLCDEFLPVEFGWDAFALYNSGVSRRETRQTACAILSNSTST